VTDKPPGARQLLCRFTQKPCETTETLPAPVGAIQNLFVNFEFHREEIIPNVGFMQQAEKIL
jgi:hypothetical protein